MLKSHPLDQKVTIGKIMTELLVLYLHDCDGRC